MPHRIRPERKAQAPRNPDWEAAVRASFARQGVMGLIGATLGTLAPGQCEIRLPFRADLTQQNGYFHAGVTATIVDSAGGYAGLMLAPADGELLVAVGQVLKSGRNLVVTRGEVYAIRNGQAAHCATMQQTLMTMHGRA